MKFRYWHWLKRYVYWFIAIILLGTALSYPISLIIDSRFFEKPVIASKYCYFKVNNTMQDVYGAKNSEKAYQIIAYFYCDLSNDQEGIFINQDMINLGNDVFPVDVLEYSEDSVLAKIRYEFYSPQRGGNIIIATAYVPRFMLHDSIPVN